MSTNSKPSLLAGGAVFFASVISSIFTFGAGETPLRGMALVLTFSSSWVSNLYADVLIMRSTKCYTFSLIFSVFSQEHCHEWISG